MSFLRNIPIVGNFFGGGEDEQPAPAPAPPARSSPRVKQSARRSVSGSCAAASWAPDSDDELAGDAAHVSRLDKAERGAMGVALAELSRALNAEDWSVAVTVSDSRARQVAALARAARGKGTTGGLPRGVRERDVGTTPAAAAHGPPPDTRLTRPRSGMMDSYII